MTNLNPAAAECAITSMQALRESETKARLNPRLAFLRSTGDRIARAEGPMAGLLWSREAERQFCSMPEPVAHLIELARAWVPEHSADILNSNITDIQNHYAS